MIESLKIKTVIISENHELEKINFTIQNLKDLNYTTKDLVVAINKESKEIESYCKENDIMFVCYEKIEEIFYNIKNILDFDFISFLYEGDSYTENVKDYITSYVEKKNDNILICPIIYNIEKNYILNKNIRRSKTFDIFDIEKDDNKIWIHLNSCFIHKCLLEKLELSETKDIKYYAESNFLLKLILINGGYSLIGSFRLLTQKPLEDCADSKIESYDLLWYENIFNSIEDILSFCDNKFHQTFNFVYYTFLYLIKNSIMFENTNTKNKHILTGKKKEQFFNHLKSFLQQIDDDIIKNALGNKQINYHLLRLKDECLNEKIEYKEFLKRIHVMHKKKFMFNAQDIKIKVLLMDFVDGSLEIVGTYPFPFDEEKLKIYVEYLGKKIYVKKNYMYQDYKIFGSTVYSNYTFEIKIPLKKSNVKNYINFYLESANSTVKLDLNFVKPLSRLTTLKESYYTYGNYTLNYRNQGILVLNNSKLRHIKRELKFLKFLLFQKNQAAKKSFFIRVIYDITKPFYRKKIWIFEDKIYKGGDNGEYMYTYASLQKDGIKKYYVLDKNSLDAKRFKKEHKKFVAYGTLRHKLIFLNSNVVFTTHNNATKHHSFDETIEKYFRDLFNSTNVCIQHGLTVQYIPHLTNRINDNLKQFFLASPIEMVNMKTSVYAYEGHEDVLNITGSPRYDGLINHDKKQILITPTWRIYLAEPVVKMGDARNRNNDFKQSDYFKIYNSFINNKKLIEVAKKTGYKLIYLLHPCTSPQIDDFDKNDYVELIAATDNLNYEKILTESSLMVTDFSGVQFDFAYMYKPIIYFHPDELPPSYDEGEYKYDSMALGEITKTLDETINLLCDYMENNCQIKKEYKKRIDKFFKYHDHDNCKRIYDEMIKFQESIK